ncbi:MAG: glycosyltransferase family 2 protein [Syntrophaceae bacterium]|nr:glycosyltransferase family 2 protein [Syntrophaceae bacterium]
MDISVIIVNWNTKELLGKCLASVYDTINLCDFEVIVVDNSSSDGSAEMLAQNFPQVITIKNKENRGFGAANNQAFAIMKSKYALLINTDAVLTPGAVNKLWSFAKTQPRAAIVCGQLLNADGSKQNSVASFPTLLTLATNISLLEYLFPKKYPSKRYEHKEPIEVDSAIGACMLIRKQALDEVGFFDERYFFFFEETDLAYAMRHKGWKIYHVPDAFIYHLQGQSIGGNAKSRIEFYRSRYQFLQKWHSQYYYRAARVIIFLRMIIDFTLNALVAIGTMGFAKNIRRKLIIYAQLIMWHIKNNKR